MTQVNSTSSTIVANLQISLHSGSQVFELSVNSEFPSTGITA
ncbi:MAG: molybdate transport system ATP-binding protein, partial [Bermanella sp.]